MTPEKYDYTAKTRAVGGSVRRLNKLPGFCFVDAKKHALCNQRSAASLLFLEYLLTR